MAIRKVITKKLRFEIFKRDSFCCQYCGQTPPKVVLEIDHINPVSAGGDNSEDNLITACFDCNRGKGASELTEVPPGLTQKAELLKEKKEQLKEYNSLLKSIKKDEDKAINEIEAAFQVEFPSRQFTDHFRESIRRFLKSIPAEELAGYMRHSCSKFYSDPSRSIKYFCGICWRVIGEQVNG